MAVIAAAGSTLVGRTVLAVMERVLRAGHIARPRSEVCGLSILLGMGFTAGGAFVWSDLGGPLNAGFSWGQIALRVVVGLATIAVCGRSGTDAVRPVEVSPLAAGGLARICQVGVGVMIALAFAQTFLTPQRFWDERAIFAIKSRVLYETKSIDAPELKHPDFVQYHPRYPLLIPLLERHTYALCGEVNDRWAKVWFPLMYAGLVLSFAGVLSRRSSPDAGWLMATLLATVPVLMPDEYGFLCAQADAPLACFHGVAVLLLWDAFQATPGGARRIGLFLAAAMAACAVFTKDEGQAFMLVHLLAGGLALLLSGGHLGSGLPGDSRIRSAGRQLVAMVAFALIAAVLLTPWMIHRRTLPTTTEMHYFERLDVCRLIDRLSTLRWSIPHLVHRMFGEWRTWGLPWWMVLLAIVTAPRRSFAGPQLFLLLNLLGALAAFVVAGMLAPAELEEHLGGSSARYLMQLVPVAVLFVAGAWGRVGHVSSVPVPSPSTGRDAPDPA